jgi:hypothetical protein
MRLVLLSLTATLLLTSPARAADGNPSLDGLFPIPENVRQILDQRCVFCHGEVIDGEKEIREDLDMSTDDAIRETLFDLETLMAVIEEDEMPYESKLSFRLRKRPEMRERLEKIIADYDENGEKEILIAWLTRAASGANE